MARTPRTAMSAMIKINNSPVLKKLGWILLMQIHDEVILEGPEETAEEAFAEVVKCMEEPWFFGLESSPCPSTRFRVPRVLLFCSGIKHR